MRQSALLEEEPDCERIREVRIEIELTGRPFRLSSTVKASLKIYYDSSLGTAIDTSTWFVDTMKR